MRTVILATIMSLFILGNNGCGSGMEIEAEEAVVDELVAESCKFLPEKTQNMTLLEKLDHLAKWGCSNLSEIEKIIQHSGPEHK